MRHHPLCSLKIEDSQICYSISKFIRKILSKSVYMLEYYLKFYSTNLLLY